ncbi:AI-2E family transporter, partial [Oscillospiraceae bacterium OttesenSCG-928-G22]|nr:AI-2E family transporter [Oscillospiraceae bacterium OttesenSCG-928-G22]
FFSSVLAKFFIGFAIAYLLSFFVAWLQKITKMRRIFAVLIGFVLLLILVSLLLLYIVPLIYDSVVLIMRNLGNYEQSISDFIAATFPSFDEETMAVITGYAVQFIDVIVTFFRENVNLTNIQNVVTFSAGILMDLSFALMIAFYALLDKERLLTYCRRLTYAVFKQERGDTIVAFFRDTHKIFSNFVVGKFLDSSIIAVLCFILFTIMGLPLAPFLAILTGIFNMIPYFGPIIGGVIVVVILLFFNFWYALYGLIITVLVQTLDGFVIGPKILGDVIGTSPLLIILAVSIGGRVGGLVGIFLGVPIIASIKILIIDKLIEQSLSRQDISKDG